MNSNNKEKLQKIIESYTPKAEVIIGDAQYGGDRLKVTYRGRTTQIRLNSSSLDNSRSS